MFDPGDDGGRRDDHHGDGVSRGRAEGPSSAGAGGPETSGLDAVRGLLESVAADLPAVVSSQPRVLPPVLGDPRGVLADLATLHATLTRLARADLSDQDVAVLLAGTRLVEQSRSLLEVVSTRATVALDDSGQTVPCTGHSTAGFLAQVPPQSARACRARVRAAGRMVDWFADVLAAVADGHLSWGHAEAVQRASRSGPLARAGLIACQAEIIDAAVGRTFDSWLRWLNGVVRRLEAAGDGPRPQDITANEVRLRWEGSALLLDGALDAAHGLELEAALEKVADEIGGRYLADHHTDSSVEVPGRATLRALAMVELARRGHAVDLASTQGPVTLTTLTVTSDDPDAVQEVHGGRFPAWMVDGLRCDEVVRVLVATTSGVPLWMGRRTRLVTPAQRAALAERDGGCVFPGCDAQVGWSRAHHVIRWSDGGPTDIDVTALLCPHHHGIVHRVGWAMDAHVDQTFSFTTPTGATLRSQRHGRVVHTTGDPPAKVVPSQVTGRVRCRATARPGAEGNRMRDRVLGRLAASAPPG